MTDEEMIAAKAAWEAFVTAAYQYSTYLDQWEKVKFSTEYGDVYVTITRSSQHPESFERISVHDLLATPEKATK